MRRTKPSLLDFITWWILRKVDTYARESISCGKQSLSCAACASHGCYKKWWVDAHFVLITSVYLHLEACYRMLLHTMCWSMH